jgi:hypothetical protein
MFLTLGPGVASCQGGSPIPRHLILLTEACTSMGGLKFFVAQEPSFVDASISQGANIINYKLFHVNYGAQLSRNKKLRITA